MSVLLTFSGSSISCVDVSGSYLEILPYHGTLYLSAAIRETAPSWVGQIVLGL